MPTRNKALLSVALLPAALSLLLSTAHADDEDEEPLEPRLRLAGEAPLNQCCSQSGRCLSVLTRADTPEALEAACAAIGITSGARLTPVRSCGPRPGRDLLGLRNRQLRGRGWWQDGSPLRNWAPHTYPAAQVAASTEGCSTLPVGSSHVVAGWAEARERCARTGYRTAHLYISMSRDFVDPYLSTIASSDPWLDDDETSGRAYELRASSAEDIQRVVGGMLERCEVADHVVVASHGNSGLLSFKDKSDQHALVSLNDFLDHILSPCLLAPDSRVQFIGCLMACGPAAETARRDIERIYTAPKYRTSGYRSLGGTQILLSTSLNQVGGGTWTPEGDQAIEYTVTGDTVTTDIPTSSARNCDGSKPL